MAFRVESAIDIITGVRTFIHVGGVTSPYKYFELKNTHEAAAPTRTTCCEVSR